MASFRLTGRDFTLERKDVVRACRRLNPDPIRKYYVVVDGKRYPPKQVIAAALQIAPAEFTTQDAVRVLRHVDLFIETED